MKKTARSLNFDLIALASTVALAALIFLPVFIHSSPNGDDIAQHYWWSKEFVSEIREGAIYPSWLSGAYEGGGSPVMLYYPPIPFYAMSFFYIFVRDPLAALNAGCWLALAISGATMFLLARSFLSRRDSILAAGFYLPAGISFSD